MRRARLLAEHKKAAQPESITSFRAAEKKYQSRVPPPDYSAVLDVSTLPGSPIQLSCTVQEELFSNDLKLHTLRGHEGIAIIPAALTPAAQRLLVQQLLTETARAPNASNLDTHYIIPGQGLWACYCDAQQGKDMVIQARHQVEPVSTKDKVPDGRRLIEGAPDLSMAPKKPAPPSQTVQSEPASKLMRKLRWTNLGLLYHWTSKSYQQADCPPVPPIWAELSESIVEALHLGPFKAESGIVNYYQLKSTLMAHVDQSEVAQQPLVSISLGHSAVFLLGGETRDVAPTAIYLHSGDVLVMSGPARKAFHGIPRILEDTLPAHLNDWEPYSSYLATTRINVNIRQVF